MFLIHKTNKGLRIQKQQLGKEMGGRSVPVEGPSRQVVRVNHQCDDALAAPATSAVQLLFGPTRTWAVSFGTFQRGTHQRPSYAMALSRYTPLKRAVHTSGYELWPHWP